MTTPLPDDRSGLVVARLLALMEDGADPGSFLDYVPVAGEVYFDPEVDDTLNVPQAATPTMIFPTRVTGYIDAEGDLVDKKPGAGVTPNKGVPLLATDLPETNPTGFTYKVSFKVRVGSRVLRKRSFSITVSAGQVTDLAVVAPVSTSKGIQITQGPPGEPGSPGAAGEAGKSAYQSWLDLGNVGDEAAFIASLEGSDGLSAYQIAVNGGFIGTETEWLESLRGADGESVDSSVVLADAKAYTDSQIAEVGHVRNTKAGSTAGSDSNNKYSGATTTLDVTKPMTLNGISFYAIETGTYALKLDGIEITSLVADTPGIVYKFEGFKEFFDAGSHTVSVVSEVNKRVRHSTAPSATFVGQDYDFVASGWQEFTVASYSIPLTFWITTRVNGTLEGLDNVSDNQPNTGDIMRYDFTSGQWTPTPLPSGVQNINDLGDVDTFTTTPMNGEVLTFDTSSQLWTPKPIPPSPSSSGGGSEQDTGWWATPTWDPYMPDRDWFMMRRVGNVVYIQARQILWLDEGFSVWQFMGPGGLYDPVPPGITPRSGYHQATAKMAYMDQWSDRAAKPDTRHFSLRVNSTEERYDVYFINDEFDPATSPTGQAEVEFVTSYLTRDPFPPAGTFPLSGDMTYSTDFNAQATPEAGPEPTP